MADNSRDIHFENLRKALEFLKGDSKLLEMLQGLGLSGREPPDAGQASTRQGTGGPESVASADVFKSVLESLANHSSFSGPKSVAYALSEGITTVEKCERTAIAPVQGDRAEATGQEQSNLEQSVEEEHY